jgi:hypothetical protein
MNGTMRAALAVQFVWIAAVLGASGGSAPGQEPGRPAPASAQAAGPPDHTMFAPPGDCVACHNNLVSPAGEDVSIGAAWSGTIMANSARDPYWQASVRRETIDHPKRAADIEDECAACHMPAGQKAARAAGGLGQVFAHLPARDAAGAPLAAVAVEGVSCAVCHQIAPDRLGTRESFNGNFVVAPPLEDGTRRAFGPFETDTGRRRIMRSAAGFQQVLGGHLRESEFCATCHTLITEAFGPDGSVIGSLPEQMNYQEWRHSAFYAEQRSCQSCHMPVVEGPVAVSSVLGEPRDTLSRHVFVGGNAFMLRLLNRFRAELGVTATSASLEATARATERQIGTQTADVTIDQMSIANGTLALDVSVRNITGHKFPTGYPSRRAWLHVTARSAGGAVLFESGAVRPDGSIDGNDSDASAAAFEPHYEEITQPDQVQIYESIMGTPAGTPTTGLLQATQYLKDNRLLPRGFDKQTAAAEIGVFGRAMQDADFAGEGDRVRYRVPVNAPGPIVVEVELRYQTIAFRWARNLSSYTAAAEPKAFLSYYDALASSSSLVVARATRRTP